MGGRLSRVETRRISASCVCESVTGRSVGRSVDRALVDRRVVNRPLVGESELIGHWSVTGHGYVVGRLVGIWSGRSELDFWSLLVGCLALVCLLSVTSHW